MAIQLIYFICHLVAANLWSTLFICHEILKQSDCVVVLMAMGHELLKYFWQHIFFNIALFFFIFQWLLIAMHMGKIILKIINDKSVGAVFFHAEIYNCMKLKNVYVYIRIYISYPYPIYWVSHLGRFISSLSPFFTGGKSGNPPRCWKVWPYQGLPIFNLCPVLDKEINVKNGSTAC